MTDRKMIAPAALSVLATAAVSLAADPTAAELRQQIDQLQQQVNRIEQKAATSQEQAATIERVLDDAQRRSQLLQSGGLTAGYDKGFFIGSADGKFTLRPGLQFQFRNITNFSEGGKSDGGDDLENGFEVRRARFRFDGNAFSKDLKYSFVWDSARQGGTVSLLDALVEYKFADQWSVKIGQFKESWTHEKDVSGFRQLAVDRTLVDAVIGGNVTDRVQGIALIYGGGKEDALRAEVAFHDGANSKNTDYRDSDGDGNTRPDTNFGFGGRVDYKFGGDWGAYRDFSAKGTKEDLTVLGGGFEYTEAGDAGTWRGTIDAQYENTTGLHLYGAGLIAYTDGDDDETNYGVLGQVGYLLNPSWEVFGRYSLLLLDDDSADEDTFNEITLGVNYFLGADGSAGQNAKVTLDFVWLPDGTPSAQTGLGYSGSDDAQYVIRGQLQLAL